MTTATGASMPVTARHDAVTVSADGSRIAYTRRGDGPPVILVAGAFGYRGFGPMDKIADQLVDEFAAVTYDRRGRGESRTADLDYHPAQEHADLQALIDANGGHAHVFGYSSGASLVLQAAADLRGVDSIAIYETPYIIDGTRRPYPPEYVTVHDQLARDGKHAALIDYFMTTGIGLPRIVPALSRLNPQWRTMKALAPTLAQDARLVHPYGTGRDYPAGAFAGITAPVWVGWGGKSPEWMRNANKRVAEILAAQHCAVTTAELRRQTHLVKPVVLGPQLRAHFRAVAVMAVESRGGVATID